MNNSLEVLLNGMQFRKLLEKELVDLEKKHSLCKIDMQILFYLHQSGSHNTSRDILSLNLFTKGHVSQSLSRMHLCGLVEMRHDTHDKRCVHVFLTKKANEIIESVGRVYSELNSIVLDGITDEERSQLLNIAVKINRNISRVLEVNKNQCINKIGEDD